MARLPNYEFRFVYLAEANPSLNELLPSANMLTLTYRYGIFTRLRKSKFRNFIFGERRAWKQKKPVEIICSGNCLEICL